MRAKWLMVVLALVGLTALTWVPGFDPVPTGVFAQGNGAPAQPGTQAAPAAPGGPGAQGARPDPERRVRQADVEGDAGAGAVHR